MRVMRGTAHAWWSGVITAAVLVVAWSAAEAITVRPGFDQRSLAESSFGPVEAEIGFGVNLGTAVYNSLYVHLQGAVTFGQQQLSFSPRSMSVGSDWPIIAPFWVEVDPRQRENVTFGQGQFKGRDAFAVTWREVSPTVDGATSRPQNTFQMILVDRSETGHAGAFDMYFIYEVLEYDQGVIAKTRRARRNVRYATAGADFADPDNPGSTFDLPGSGEQGQMIGGGEFDLVEVELAPTAVVRVAPTGGNQVVVTPPTEATASVTPVPLPASAPIFAAALIALASGGYRRRRAA